MRRTLFAVLLLAPSLAAALWTCHPAALAAWAAATLGEPTLAKGEWDDPLKLLELRRKVQKHFLDHDVYIPMEDIVAASQQDADSGTLSLLMQKACGRGKLFIWIPFKFKLPVTGEKVFEWCWKPETKDA